VGEVIVWKLLLVMLFMLLAVTAVPLPNVVTICKLQF
jgi:hypothetical protein